MLGSEGRWLNMVHSYRESSDLGREDGSIVLDSCMDSTSGDKYEDVHPLVGEVSPSLAPSPVTSIGALVTKNVMWMSFVAMGIVALWGFIRAIQYPQTRKEWEYANPVIEHHEGTVISHIRITSPVPCAPTNGTQRWEAYQKYKATSLGTSESDDGWGNPPDCASSNLDPDCWVMNGKCNQFLTWADLDDQRNEAFQHTREAKVQEVYPSSPIGEISTRIKLARGPNRGYAASGSLLEPGMRARRSGDHGKASLTAPPPAPMEGRP